jgi:magnesium chelatase subunit I
VDDDDRFTGLTAVEKVPERRSAPAAAPGPYDRIVASFTKERKIVLSDDTPFSQHLKALESVDGLSDLVLKHAQPRDHFERAFLMELVLEGLVQNLRIAREDLDSTITYAEMAKFNVLRSRG